MEKIFFERSIKALTALHVALVALVCAAALWCASAAVAAAHGEAAAAPVDGGRILFGTIGEASNLIPYLTADAPSHEIADLLYVAPLRYDQKSAA